MPSELFRISSNFARAAGFSIFDKIAARPFANSRASITSSGRCTKDRANQSMPNPQANSKSVLSFSDKAAKGRMTSGTFTPFLSEIIPPALTMQSAESLLNAVTSSLILPSFTNKIDPIVRAAKISGCGRLTLLEVPKSVFRSRRNSCPSTRISDSFLNSPTRSFGPCRSASIPIGLFNSSSIFLMVL